MEGLAGRDIDRAQEALYHAAKRYCALVEQDFLEAPCTDPANEQSFNRTDSAAARAEARQRYTEAYARYMAFLPHEEPEKS
jgi:hypothetical protein